MRGLLTVILTGLAAAALTSVVTWRVAKHRYRADSWVAASQALHDLAAAYRLVAAGQEPDTATVKLEEALQHAMNFCGEDFRSAAQRFIDVGQLFAAGDLDTSYEQLTQAKQDVDAVIRKHAKRLAR